MKQFDGRVAAITGAASGIGRGLAQALVARGAHVALSDVDEVGLADTVARCEQQGAARVSSARVDVADRAAVFEWAEKVRADHGQVNLIVNNAGVALGATVSEMAIEDFEWLMGINFWGVVHGTQAFLPHLEASGEGHVVNVSSVFGLISIPTQSAYNAAKFGVRGFSDALRIELEIARSCVSVTTVHPGGVKTNIARNARLSDALAALDDGGAEEFERMARTVPESAAEQILLAVSRDRRRALIGPDARVFDLVSRLPAAVSQGLLVAAARRRQAATPPDRAGMTH